MINLSGHSTGVRYYAAGIFNRSGIGNMVDACQPGIRLSVNRKAQSNRLAEPIELLRRAIRQNGEQLEVIGAASRSQRGAGYRTRMFKGGCKRVCGHRSQPQQDMRAASAVRRNERLQLGQRGGRQRKRQILRMQPQGLVSQECCRVQRQLNLLRAGSRSDLDRDDAVRAGTVQCRLIDNHGIGSRA
ncbi:hypothetical protein D3C71_1598150 [compost metagenome]